jgi:hypothetical protein
MRLGCHIYKHNRNIYKAGIARDLKGTKLIEKHYKKLNDSEKEMLHHFKKIGVLVLNLVELRIDMEF